MPSYRALPTSFPHPRQPLSPNYRKFPRQTATLSGRSRASQPLSDCGNYSHFAGTHHASPKQQQELPLPMEDDQCSAYAPVGGPGLQFQIPYSEDVVHGSTFPPHGTPEYRSETYMDVDQSERPYEPAVVQEPWNKQRSIEGNMPPSPYVGQSKPSLHDRYQYGAQDLWDLDEQDRMQSGRQTSMQRRLSGNLHATICAPVTSGEKPPMWSVPPQTPYMLSALWVGYMDIEE